MKFNFSILLIILLNFYSSNQISRKSGKNIKVPELTNPLQLTQTNVDPLSLHIALGQSQQQRTVLFAKNIKALFKSMYIGYYANLLKYKINPKKVFDAKKKKFVKKIKKLKRVKCKDPHSVIFNGKYLANLYQEIYHIDVNNIKSKPISILNNLLKVILETGNKCTNLLDYYHYFKDEFHELEYLKTTSHSSKFNNPGLLLQVSASKKNFLVSWGKFGKMGEFLGKLLSWFRIYKPPSVAQQQAVQLATLLKLLKSAKKKSGKR